MLTHTTAATPGSVYNNVYPEAQRLVTDDVIDTVVSTHASHMADNMTLTHHQPVIIVRAEEALILIMVLILWIAAIALFFNRWGKIRMLEPYQPKFIQQHRPSCPLVDAIQQRSFSKFNLTGNDLILTQPHHFLHCSQQQQLRPRQNSVFVASSMVTLPMNPPRKVKSAFDLNNLVLSDPALNRSCLRQNLDLRRSSIIPDHVRQSMDSRNNSICSTSAKNATNEPMTAIDRLPVKSGVLDFRRNSMLIINNLAEEISPLPFNRHFSLGGSNLNLTPDIPPLISPRRNSVIPPCTKFKPKTPHKASKSLDCERSPGQLYHNARKCSDSQSSEALTYPKIVETHCITPPPISASLTSIVVSKVKDNSPYSSQLNLLANDQVYYSSIADGSDTQQRIRHSAYKVTHV